MLGSEVVDAGAAVALSSLSAILDDFTPIDPAPVPRLFVSQGPDKGKPERFPGGAELPVELPPPVVEPPARRARNRRAR